MKGYAPISDRIASLDFVGPNLPSARGKGLLAFGGQAFLVPGHGLIHDLGEGWFGVDLIVADALQHDQLLGFTRVGV